MTGKVEVNPVADCTPNTVPIIPDDWAALGVTSGYNPKSVEALRLFIVGPSGEGKTTFDSSIGDNIILDFDDGANACPGSKSVRIHIKDYSHFDAVITKFVADSAANKRHWVRVSFDTIDEVIAMIKHQLEEEKKCEDITEFGSMGHGYNLILERLWSKVLDLEQAGYSWAFLGHMRNKTEVDPTTRKEVTKVRESVYPIIAKKILTKADFKLTIYCLPQTVENKIKKVLPGGKVIEVPVGTTTKLTYYLDSMTTEARDNKSRGVPTMDRKFEIPLVGGWDIFKKKYEDAVEAARKQYK